MRSFVAFLTMVFLRLAAFAQDAPLRVIDVHLHPEFSDRRAQEELPATRKAFDEQWKRANLAGAVGILHTSDGCVASC